MEREISLDTETTGLEPSDGHRIIEIGAVEMINRIPTGKTFHKYINPKREVSEGAVKIHGITNEFLSDKPEFSDVVDDFLNFIGKDKLVIHNAAFDMKFLNAELFHQKKPEIPYSQAFCTLIHARKKFPGAANNLDALCRRFGIDNSHREKHGALLDAEILAEVYLELMGGAQVSIGLNDNKNASSNNGDIKQNVEKIAKHKADFDYRSFNPDKEEIAAHEKMLEQIKDPIWNKI
jgi:DNA polymerase-3 subunit epsilon